MMRVEYENKFIDILAFNAAHQFMSPVLQGLFLLFAGLIFLGELSEVGVIESSIIAVIWYFILWLAQFVFNTIYLYSRNNHSVLTRHIVEIQNDAFYEETKYNKSHFYWPGVIKVVKRLGLVAVYVTPQLAHIIPRRAFSSLAQRKEFIQQVKSKLRENA